MKELSLPIEKQYLKLLIDVKNNKYQNNRKELIKELNKIKDLLQVIQGSQNNVNTIEKVLTIF